MKIVGYEKGFEFDGKRFLNTFDGKTRSAQLHISDGFASNVTGFARKYFSPFSWKPIHIETDGTTKKALIYFPFEGLDEYKNLERLYGESLYWTRIIGNNLLENLSGDEFLVSKNPNKNVRVVGHRKGGMWHLKQSRDDYIPIYRAKTLYQKIKCIFCRIFHCSFLSLEVKSPNSGEKFWIDPMDYAKACAILGEELICDKSRLEKLQNEMAVDSTQVCWV